MSKAEAHQIADEHIAWWRSRGVTETQAYEALLGHPVWCAMWWEVRAFMVSWLLAEYGAAERLAA